MEELTERVIQGLSRLPADNRFIVGIVGYPGAGKSTLAEALVAALNARLPIMQRAQILPMDGYHLPNHILDSLGLRALKGIPDTFDPLGFITLLRQIRQSPPLSLTAPAFDRTIDASVENAIEIAENTKVIVAEGNYLLLESERWCQIAELLDDSWFLDTSLETIRPRLISRHVQGGKELEAAIAKVESTDLPNALLIEKTRGRAKALVRAVESPLAPGCRQYEIVSQ